MAKVTWHQDALDFLEYFDFPKDIVIDVLRRPEEKTLDPSSEERGYPVYRFRRGDVTVVLGAKYSVLTILYVYLHTPEDGTRQHKSIGGAVGSGGKAPTSERQLVGWIKANGMTIRMGGKHRQVYYGDVYLGSISSTAHARTYVNEYQKIRRRYAAEKIKKENGYA